MATDTQKPQLITLSERAIEHVSALLARQNKPYLRVKVVGGGCSGMSYKLDTADAPNPDDRVLEFGDLKVLVDLKSTLYLVGIEIDYSDDLMNAGFHFQNPNATRTCGCGESFGV